MPHCWRTAVPEKRRAQTAIGIDDINFVILPEHFSVVDPAWTF